MNYHDDFDRVSKTMLATFLKSRHEYGMYYVSRTVRPPKPSRQMVIGSAVHAILLDKLSPRECIAIYTDDCFKHDKLGRPAGLHPQKAEEFRNQWPNRHVLKPHEYSTVKICVDSVRQHPLGKLIETEGAVFETPYYWTCPESGLECRAMADMLVVGDTAHVYDLKTTERVSPSEFQKVAKQFRYWLQDSHYSAGLAATLDQRPVNFVFWAIEVKPPYRIARYQFPEHERENNRDRYLHTMLELKQCYDSGDWVDPWTKQTNYLTVSPWEVDEPSEELDWSESDEE